MTATAPKRKPLNPVLRQQINVLAHDLALRHETRLRAELMAQVQTAADAGATAAELAALVDSLRPAP